MAQAAVLAILIITTAPLLGANGCQGEFYESGALKSPGYPSMYRGLINCTWSLQASPGGNVFLRLESLDRIKCCSVSCRGSGSRIACDLRSYRNSKVITAPFNLTAGHETIFSVQADGLDIGVAFHFMFTTVVVPGCGGVLHGSGSFSSPLHPKAYDNFAYCKWELHALPTDGYILMQIMNFRSEKNYDFLRIYGNGSLLAEFHGSVNATNITLGNEATIVFETDHINTDLGFKVQFHTVSSLDALPLLSSDSVRLTSGCHFMNVSVRNVMSSEGHLTASYYEVWISSMDATSPITYTAFDEKPFYSFTTTPGTVYNVTVCPVAAWTGVNRRGTCVRIFQNSGALHAVASLTNECVNFAIKSTHSECTLPEIEDVACENSYGSKLHSASNICSLQPDTGYNCSLKLKDYSESLVVFLTTPKGNRYQNVDGLTFPCSCKATNECQLKTGFCNSSCDDVSWGPGCQVGEILSKRVSVEQSSTEQSDEKVFGAHLAIDGNLLTCSRTASFMNKNSWWSANFVNNDVYFIHQIKIVAGIDVKRIVVLLTNSSEAAMPDSSSWAEWPLANVSSTVYTCEPRVAAKKIAVYAELYSSSAGLAICEITAYGYLYQKCTERNLYGPGCLMRQELPLCATEQLHAANHSKRNKNVSASADCVQAKQLQCCKDTTKYPKGINGGSQCLNVSTTPARWKINHSQMSKTLAQLKVENKGDFSFYKIHLHENFSQTYIEATKFPLQTTYASRLCTVL